MRKPVAVWALLILAFCGAGYSQPDRPSVPKQQLTRLEEWAVARLGAESRHDRQDAAKILGALRTPLALSLLSDLVRKDSEPGVRREAVRALGWLEGSAGVPVLTKVLADDADGRVRTMAATALGNIGDTAAAPALVAALRDETVRVGVEAAEALGRLGARQAADELYAALARDGEPGAVRRAAASALSRLGDARAVPFLLDQLRRATEEKQVEEDEPIAEEDGLVEADLDEEDLDEEDWVVAEELDRAALAAADLGRLKARQAVPALIAALGAGEPLFTEAARALRAIGDPAGLQALDRLGLDPERGVVFPFANRTGDPALDWVGYGLQADLSLDLAQVPTFEPWLPTLEQKESFDPARRQELLHSARQWYEADQVWYGEYERDGQGLRVRIVVLATAGGEELARHEVTAALDELPRQASESLLSLAAALNAPVDETAKRRVLAPATRSVEAWKQYSLGKELGHELQRAEAYGTTPRKIFEGRAETAQRAVGIDPGFAAPGSCWARR
jgi:HEAT repeat protein/TolB-like protein